VEEKVIKKGDLVKIHSSLPLWNGEVGMVMDLDHDGDAFISFNNQDLNIGKIHYKDYPLIFSSHIELIPTVGEEEPPKKKKMTREEKVLRARKRREEKNVI